MGWSIGYDSNWQRDIGYGVPAKCDFPGCAERIDRGLGYVCGNGLPEGGDEGCGLYFCSAHGGGMLCKHCSAEDGKTFGPSPDVREWIEHKLNHESWGDWRTANPSEVETLRKALGNA